MLQALTERLPRSQPVLDVGEAAGCTHGAGRDALQPPRKADLQPGCRQGKGPRVSWVCVPALLLTGCVTLGRHAPSLGLRLPICKTKPGILTEEAARATAHEAWGPRPHLFSSPSSIPSSDVQPFTGKSVGSVRTRVGLGLCFSNHGRGQLEGPDESRGWGWWALVPALGGRDTPQRKSFLSFFLEAVPVTHGHGRPAAHP